MVKDSEAQISWPPLYDVEAFAPLPTRRASTLAHHEVCSLPTTRVILMFCIHFPSVLYCYRSNKTACAPRLMSHLQFVLCHRFAQKYADCIEGLLHLFERSL